MPHDADALFEAFVERVSSGEEPDFEALCLLHPEAESALRRLHTEWRAVLGDLRGDTLSMNVGDVGAGPDSGADLSATTSDVVERLRKRLGDESRYEILGEFARGGMGAVLRVFDRDLRRTLAMKVVLGQADASTGDTPAIDERSLGRFLEEAQVTGQLDHPGIVPVHELGLDADGRVFFTMKLVKGDDLRQVFERVRDPRDEEWTTTRALSVMLRVCEAMAFAHSKKVIHRDLKPGNVMVGRFGEVYVMDWGLARVIGQADQKDIRLRTPAESLSHVRTDRREESADDSPLVTMDGDVVGTPAYMPPEQAMGKIEEVGPPADVYAVGAMLYQLLTGWMPYVEPGARLTARTILALATQAPPKPVTEIRKDVPPELVAIVEKAMARDIGVRYPDMTALAEDLRAYLDGRVVQAHRTGPWVELRKWVQRNRFVAGAAATAALAICIGFITTSLGYREANEQRLLAETNAAEAKRQQEAAEENAEAEAKARRTIESNAYFANLELADAWFELRELDRFRERLDSCPRRLRGWEWFWLDANADNSLVKIEEPGLVFSGFNLDGTRILTTSYTGTHRVWDAATGQRIAELTTAELEDYGFGTRSVSWSDDGPVRVVDVMTRESVAELNGHKEAVRLATISRDGTRAVTVSEATRIWDAVTGTIIAELEGHTDEVSSASFSPDGTWVVTASDDNTARVWDGATGASVAELNGHTDAVSHASFSFDGARIVTISADNTARVWDVATGTSLAELKGDNGHGVTRSWFSRDGTRVVTTSEDGAPRVWNAETGANLAELAGDHGPDEFAHFSPDGTRIVTMCSGDTTHTARVWDAETGVKVAELKGHTDTVRFATFSPDGTRIVTASADDTARVWDAAAGSTVVDLMGPVGAANREGNDIVRASFSPDGTRILTVSRDHIAHVWDTATGSSIADLTELTENVLDVAFSPDGRQIATSGGNARIWDVTTKTSVAEFNRHDTNLSPGMFSPDGSQIVTLYDKIGWVWDVATGTNIAKLIGHTSSHFTATFSPDGTRILTAAFDGTSRVWDAATGNQVAQRDTGGPFWLSRTSFSPDSSRVVTVSPEKSLVVWDAATGLTVVELKGTGGSPSFSPDGTRILTLSGNTPIVWDALTGTTVAELRGHTSTVNSASFNPDGTRIVTASYDGTSRVWDATTGAALAELRGQSWGIYSASFSPDGTRIVTASQTGVRLWDAIPNRVAFAERQLRQQNLPWSHLRTEFAREMRGTTRPTWLTDPSLSENRPNFIK